MNDPQTFDGLVRISAGRPTQCLFYGAGYAVAVVWRDVQENGGLTG